MPRILLLLLCVCLASAGESRPTTFVFEETVAGKPSPITDRSTVEAIANQHRERLARARAELPAAIPLVARQLRSDIGAMEAELERLAVIGGGTITVGRRIYVLTATTITVDADGTRIEVDLASRRGTASSGSSSEPAPVVMAPPPDSLPLTAGKPGEPVLGRATLVFLVNADGRDYNVRIDPTLPNALAYLIPSEGDDVPITIALARLPGMPLDIAHDSGDFVRRFTCVEAK